MAWQKEADAAIKALEGLRKKLDRAVERQRKAKDKRVAAAARNKARRTAATEDRLEKAKQAYLEASAAVAELRELTAAARTRVKTAKLALARALARDRILTRFYKEYDKAQTAKAVGARGRPRKTARRRAGQGEVPSGESVPGPSGATEKEDEPASPETERA